MNLHLAFVNTKSFLKQKEEGETKTIKKKNPQSKISDDESFHKKEKRKTQGAFYIIIYFSRKRI